MLIFMYSNLLEDSVNLLNIASKISAVLFYMTEEYQDLTFLEAHYQMTKALQENVEWHWENVELPRLRNMPEDLDTPSF